MYPFKIGPNHTGYQLDRSEEVILVEAWLRVRARLGNSEAWAHEFEDYFFKNGKGVSEKAIANIERHLRRLKAPPLGLRTTVLTDYMRLRHGERIDARQQILVEIKDSIDRRSLVEVARRESA